MFGIFVGSVAAEIMAEASAEFVFDLFDNYMWHPPDPQAAAARPLDLLTELVIDE
ncbi:MAG: hypothetical protein HY246_05190 [Proteobacteria bacterium]|nr:hypothetical protein [Pseudomonadota bacterium]